LDHTAGINIVKPFLNASAISLAAGKPFLMFETNTASCGGFPGISDSYGSALWALDYGLQMAYSNFSGALLHVGGQNVYYNVCSIPSCLWLLADVLSPLIQPFTRTPCSISTGMNY
jgi:hypothetical protein